MDSDNLVHMGNRIAEFFAAMPDRAEAVDGVTLHLRRYWPPTMRRDILSRLDAQGTEGLHPLLADALQTQRALLEPAPARA